MEPPFHVLKSKTYSEKRNNLRLVLWLSRMLLLEGDTDVKKNTHSPNLHTKVYCCDVAYDGLIKLELLHNCQQGPSEGHKYKRPPDLKKREVVEKLFCYLTLVHNLYYTMHPNEP